MKDVFYLLIVVASWVIAGILGASLAVLIVSVTRVVGSLRDFIARFTGQTKRRGFSFIR